MLSVKQGGIKYHFLSLWYDSTWDWTQVSRAIGEHSKFYLRIIIQKYKIRRNASKFVYSCFTVASVLGDRGSILGRVKPKNQKIVIDASSHNIQNYKVLFTNPSARAGYDTRSIFKRSLTGFEFRVFLLLD